MAPGPNELAAVTLDDKYVLDKGRVYLTGTQALVRLPLMQRQRDIAAGLNTGCFISGYRGSPLGAFDQALWSARRFVERGHLKFQPAINEELAATAVWGSQQLGLFPGAKYDGVFAVWYGKGPGVDRSGDALKHGNSAGTAPYGGVLALAGDDHTCKSSTLAHQSEFAFIDALIPVLNPAGVEEILDLGIYGWAMSRYSGCWVAFKTVAETMDSSASINVDPGRVEIVLPQDFEMPPGGLNIRWPDPPLDQEARLHRFKVPAAIAFARANRLDRIVIDAPQPRFGIVTTGKSYLDVRQALEELGIGNAEARALGLRLYKVAMPWPLEPDGVRRFAEGLQEVLVVEEKRTVIETQLKEQLYNWPADRRPLLVGKFDESGRWILPSNGELSPSQIARVIAARLAAFTTEPWLAERVARLDARERQTGGEIIPFARTPYFCSGCPHNTSTRVPGGSRALAGIGCHYLSQFMDRNTATFTQMGGEGASWIGQAPFTETEHVFVNIGDGTYTHSGIMAIRAAVAAGVNMTYKVLFNDAVAMTGGQPLDGSLTVPRVAAQLAAEGVYPVIIVTDEPDKYPLGTEFPHGTTVRHRDELDAVQRELRELRGVSAIVYDQTCAAEKRRRRKRGRFPDPPQRVFINELVCEGCGDCSATSNCLSVVPVETEFGRKRAIDQSSCNKDFSCLKGFCPSFVTVHGGSVKKRSAIAGHADDDLPPLPEPLLPDTGEPYGILVTGVGGTGVVTIGALLGMAAHLEGKGVAVLDQLGMAQKGGAVLSHVRIADKPDSIHAVRIAAGGARLLLGCDLVVSAGAEALSRVHAGVTRAVVNSHETITGDFTRNPDLAFPSRDLRRNIAAAVGQGGAEFIDATALATGLLGDSIATNLFMLGHAYQQGLVPVSAAAIQRAIELNAVAVDFNLAAFAWGRRAAIDRVAVEARAVPQQAVPDSHHLSETLDEMVARRVAFLTDYQNAAYAERYAARIRRLRDVEAARTGGTAVTEAAARALFKVMAYKDEYEVARLYSETDFRQRVAEQFEGPFELRFHLAPPLLADRDPATGHLKKRVYGPWMLTAFGLLAKLRGLRGTPFDIFGRTEERRAERRLIGEYEAVLDEIAQRLSPRNQATAIELAGLPLEIRGFGHVKESNLHRAKAKEAGLLARLRAPSAAPALAAAE